MAKRKMKGKNLTAKREWSTIMKWQGSYQVGRKFLHLQWHARHSCVDSQFKRPAKTVLSSFSKIHLNITEFTLWIYDWFKTICLKEVNSQKKGKTESLGDIPNKASDFPHALRTHLYLLMNANLSVKFFFKFANCN